MNLARTDLTGIAALVAVAALLMPAVLASRRGARTWLGYAAVWIAIAAGLVVLYSLFG